MHEIYHLKYLMEFELKTFSISYLCWLICTICGRADTGKVETIDFSNADALDIRGI